MEYKMAKVQVAINKAYQPVFSRKERTIVLYGGAGSGKSKFAIQYFILKYSREKRTALVIRKVGATIRDSIFKEFVTGLSEMGLYNTSKINKSNLSITLKNGSLFIFKGLDDREKIKSISGIDDILIEEATELNYDDVTQLDLRLRSKASNQQIMMMFNPVSKANWTYKTYFEKEAPPNTFILKTNYKDNAFLPKAYVDNLLNMAKTNPTYFKVYALGDYATLDKLILTNYQVMQEKDIELPKDTSFIIGMDFGFTNDPTTAILLGYSASTDTLYILDEIYRLHMLTDEIYSSVVKKGFNKYRIIGDCAEPRLIKELKLKGLKIEAAKKGSDSILHGILWLQSRNIVISDKCVNTLTEFQNYTWQKDKKTEEYINKPIDDFNHCIDAIRYGCEKFNTKNRLRTLEKSALGL